MRVLSSAVLTICAAVLCPAQNIMTTVAGTSTCCNPSEGGNVYIAPGGLAGGRVRKVTVSAAALSASPNSLTFSYTTGGANPEPKSLNVTSPSGSSSFTAAASTTSGGSWLSVTPTDGTPPASVTVSINPAGVPGGSYQGAITLTPSGGQPTAFAVRLDVRAAGAPVVNSGAVYNALGYQTDLAPGTVFVVFGNGMGPSTIAAASAPDYPAQLSGTSINLTPAAGGAAIDARIVYTSSGQAAGLLPSSIAPGAYALRVTYNGLTSAPQNVTVVARSFGIATANSAGTGTAQATIGNVNGGISLTRLTSGSVAFNGRTWTLTPAHPGDTLVLWGTGGGADPANDTGGSSGDQTSAGDFKVLVNGSPITPLYAGASSGYPGLWQINFTLPADVATGCFTSVQVSAGGEPSNAVTIPIAIAGQPICSDPQLSPDDIAQLDAGGSIAFGGISLIKRSNAATATTDEQLAGGFPRYTAAEYALTEGIRVGACTILGTAGGGKPAQPEGYLDAGPRLPVAGPGLASGTAAIEVMNPDPIYSFMLGSGSITAGGPYTLTGNGGRDIGPFSANVNFPAAFSVANWDSLKAVDRSQPLTVNWTGSGFDHVIITVSTAAPGHDASNNPITESETMICQVPGAPGTYTVPAAAMAYLLPATAPQGFGALAITAENVTSFTAPLLSGGAVAHTVFSADWEYAKSVDVR